MSLLMDALKKAEKEKKEAANRIDETGPNPLLSTTSELPIDTVATESDLPDYEEGFGEYKPTSLADNLSLEPIDSLDSLSDDELPNTGQYSIPESKSPVTEASISKPTVAESYEFSGTQTQTPNLQTNQLHGNIQGDEYSEITHTLEQEKVFDLEKETHEETSENTLQDTFNASSTLVLEQVENENQEDQSDASPSKLLTHELGKANVSLDTDELQYEASLEVVDNEQFVKMLGEGARKPTPAAAETVFKAGNQKSWIKSRAGIGSFVVILLLSLSLGIFFYYWTTPRVQDLPSPMAVKAIVQNQSAQLLSSEGATDANSSVDDLKSQVAMIEHPLEPAEIESSIMSQQDKSLLDATKGIAEQVQEDRQETKPTEQQKSMPIIDQAVQPLAAGSDTGTDKQANNRPELDEQGKQVKVNTISHDAKHTEVTQPTIQQAISDEMIQITKAKKESSQKNLNQQAYDAYNAGNYDTAHAFYSETLKNTPENRDALLGLAAIHVLNEQFTEAYTKYRQILVNRPDDIDARLGILNLKGFAKENESLLKLMLRAQPDSAGLYFSLGNVYASQERWAKAQQMFFEAYRRNTNEADYALNLAVSLDQLGQLRTAKDYYQTALELSYASKQNFDAFSVQQRIETLNSAP